MKKIVLFSAFLFSLAGFAKEPENLSELKNKLVSYHDSGEYAYDLSSVVAQAREYLQERIEENRLLKKPKKLAIVLDIDETSLSNYAFLFHHDFSGAKNIVDVEMASTDATLIPSTFQLYQLAEQEHVSVFFVTGRREKYRANTVENLHEQGYRHWQHLYLAPNAYHEKSIAAFKSAIRKKLTESGYDVVLNLGDQYSDLKGGYADRTFKLPDPFYYVP